MVSHFRTHSDNSHQCRDMCLYFCGVLVVPIRLKTLANTFTHPDFTDNEGTQYSCKLQKPPSAS